MPTPQLDARLVLERLDLFAKLSGEEGRGYTGPLFKQAAAVIRDRINAAWIVEDRNALLREVVQPLAALEVPKSPQGNAGFYSIRFSDIERAKAALAEAASELPRDWDLVSRKAVVALCEERAGELIGTILDGEPSQARLRESMEAAIRRIQYAVAFMPSASGDTVISVGTDGAAEAAEAIQ